MVSSLHRGRPGRLAGKAAIITGAANGIGKATAELFSAEGGELVLNDIDALALDRVREQLRHDAERVLVSPGDISDERVVRELVATAVSQLGRLDILIANAGVIPLATIDEANAEDWDAVMAVDARGMFLCCKHALAAVTAPGGSLVLLSSISGVAGQAGQATYGPAKFVATGLTKHLAVEAAPRGIRVNAVAPGTIRTERVRRLEVEPGGPEYLRSIVRQHPLGRLGDPHEVASAILFLASDEASFITGAVLPVDGGYLAQ
jgi:NAD(P)-dependent dehydrogenase (short-subunit alcohol dehydrogenase family)